MTGKSKRTNSTPKSGRPPKGWRGNFLDMLGRTGIVILAARHAGVSRSLAYNYRNSEPDFYAAWEEAIQDASDLMEAEAFRRAVQGTNRPVYQGGKKVGEIKEYSDVLLMFLLKGNRPAKFRDNYEARVTEESRPVPTITVNLNGVEARPRPDAGDDDAT